MSHASMETLLNKALAQNGLPPVTLDEGGYALVTVAELAINIEYAEAAERLYLYSSLGKLPEAPPAALCEAVLEAELMGAGTAGGHIGLHAATRILTYSQSLDASRLDSREVANALNLFAQHSAEWIIKMGELLQSSAHDSDEFLFSGAMMDKILWG